MVDLGGAFQSFRDARADIFSSDMAFKLGLLHKLRGLLAGTAQQEGATGFVELVGQVFNGAEPGRVDRSHVAQAQDDDRREGVQRIENLCKLVRGAEKKRPVDAEDRSVFRNVLALQDVHAAVFNIIASDARDRCGPRNFADEHERGENHADFHGERKVRHDGERHG